MKIAALIVLLAAECNAPPAPPPNPVVDASPVPTPAPSPTIDAGVTPTAVRVYDELVEGGCLQADPVSGPAWVEQAMLDPRAPAWLNCIADGATTQACAVPCGDAGAPKKR